ncbi:TPA: FAD:protein FMN transferase [Candidatus Woesearchaeota archaeon]|nr:FAD:protein FMN transferase [Candidatus Woesearchaeota archaeon]HII69488.1 FAD:protein FMN transferase [Candidatus Woesearchaeota archaeon]
MQETFEALGTEIKIKLPSAKKEALAACHTEIERIEKAYSRFRDGSELSRANARLNRWQPISTEFLFLLEKALALNRETNGAFDVTIKNDLERLGYDASYSFTPKVEKKKHLLKKAMERFTLPIRIDSAKSQVYLKKQVDFGGFGKGFALDRVAGLLESKGVRHYYLNAGGDILAKKGEGLKPWIIILEHPVDASRAIGTIQLDGKAITCSSPNRRRWGKHHHLLNAKTRLPANELKCSFVLAGKGIDADAYATALCTSTFVESIALSKRLPIEALLVSIEGKMYKSEGFKASLFT